MVVKIQHVPVEVVKEALTPGARKRTAAGSIKRVAAKKTPYAVKPLAKGAGQK